MIRFLFVAALLVSFPLAALAGTCGPGKVTNLSIGGGKTTAVANWTNTGDDCSSGTCTSWEVRYDTQPITDTNWQSATVGATGSCSFNCTQITGLTCNTTYYWVIFIFDGAGNRSPISNMDTEATAACNGVEIDCP